MASQIFFGLSSETASHGPWCSESKGKTFFCKRFHARLAAVFCGLVLFSCHSAALPVEANAANPYPLPRDKSAMEPCKQGALNAHPGHIQGFQTKSTLDGFQYRFEIRGPSGGLWAVVCDAVTQRIIKVQSLEW